MRNARKILYILVPVLIFSVLILEIAVRLYISYTNSTRYTLVRSSEWIYSPHPYLSYSLTKNYSKGKVHHNSLGYRNKEFKIEKDKNEIRMAFLGGSTTYTDFVDDNSKVFTNYIEKQLNKIYKKKEITVINAGVGGYSSHESLINLQFRVLDLLPDFIFIYHGPNDVHTRYLDPSKYHRDNTGRRSVWNNGYSSVFKRSALLRFFLIKYGIWRPPDLYFLVSSKGYKHPDHYYPDKINHKSSEPYGENLLKNEPVYFKSNIESIISIARLNNIRVVLMTFAYSEGFGKYTDSKYYQAAIAEQNEILRQISRDMNVYLLDFAKRMPNNQKFYSDGVHLNELGSKIKGKIISNFIINNLEIDQL